MIGRVIFFGLLALSSANAAETTTVQVNISFADSITVREDLGVEAATPVQIRDDTVIVE